MVDERYRNFADYRIQHAIVDLWRQGQTGILKAKLGANKHALYMKEGVVVGGLTAEPRFKLPKILIRRGYLTHAQYTSARINFKPELSVGANLLEMGLITRQELERGARQQVYAIFSGFIRSSAGRYYFREQLLPDDLDQRPLNFPRDIFHAVLAMKDKAWIVSQFDDGLDFICERNPEYPLDPAKLGLGQFTDRAYEMIDGVNDFKKIVFEADTDDFLLLKFFYTLKLLNYINITSGNSDVHGGTVGQAAAGVLPSIDEAVLEPSPAEPGPAEQASGEELMGALALDRADAPLDEAFESAEDDDFPGDMESALEEALDFPFLDHADEESPGETPEPAPHPDDSDSAADQVGGFPPEFDDLTEVPDAPLRPNTDDALAHFLNEPVESETPTTPMPTVGGEHTRKTEILPRFDPSPEQPAVVPETIKAPPPRRQEEQLTAAVPTSPKPKPKFARVEVVVVALLLGVCIFLALFFLLRTDYTPPDLSMPPARAERVSPAPALVAENADEVDAVITPPDSVQEPEAKPAADVVATQTIAEHQRELEEDTAAAPAKEKEPDDSVTSKPLVAEPEPLPETSQPSAASSAVDAQTLLARRDYAAAANQWQREAANNKNSWTITLFLLCDPSSLPRVTDQAGGDPAYFLLGRRVSGKACYLACWGVYDSRLEALRQTKNLPSEWDPTVMEVRRLADLL